ncbi:zinc-dependent alcohol dehydrogenase [Paenibacillus koleovorans]|uniref:zinc-dependent alcohol dehydrogenase n=1 Tax=Paenibacillus koleovorans TaxID=121608 RepID=UPI000FD7BE2A|nr:alcohol dehydrogenase catalytic domain-containing protein [Paenibacillus koleovorans]
MLALMKLNSGPGNVELAVIPEPACGPGMVKVRVACTGICGTDLHVYHDTFKNYPPVTLGHEFAGEIVEAGSGVRRLKAGDRVAVLGSTAVVCGQCEYCRQGHYMFCPVRRGMGHGVNGSFTKYVVVREDQAYLLPDEVSYEEGALSEPFACAVQAIEELTDIHAGDTVLLTGPGPIGLLCLMLLVAKGCKTIVAGTKEDAVRLEMAGRLGADVVVDVSSERLADIVDRETQGRGVDVSVDCSGAARGIVSCFQSLKKMGKHIQVGIIGQDVTLPYDTILYKQAAVFGSLGHSLKSWDGVLRLLKQRKIELSRIITHKLPLSQWREAFELCESKQGVKVLISYDE